MDTFITSESADSGTAVTENPASSAGTENAASENTQEQSGGSKDTAEGSQQDTGAGRKRWSIQDEVKELRSQRRELREQLSSFGTVREELAALREELNRRNQPNVEKGRKNFWEDPEGTLDSKLDERLERLQNNMFERFQQTREQEFASQRLHQEQRSATEFIRSQQNYDSADDEDLIEIISEIPNKESLSPQWVAEYAWLKLQQQRGVGNKSLAKARASSVQGQPPGQSFGRKVWNKSEFDAALDMIEKAPHDPKHSELIKELEAAHKEGRVK